MRIVDLGEVHPREAQAVEDRLQPLVRAGIESTALVVQPTEGVTAGADTTWEELASLVRVASPIERPGGVELTGPGLANVLCIAQVGTDQTPSSWRSTLVAATAAALADLGVPVADTSRTAVLVEVEGVESEVATVRADVVDGVTTHGVTVSLRTTPGAWLSTVWREHPPEVPLERVLDEVPSPCEVARRIVEHLPVAEQRAAA